MAVRWNDEVTLISHPGRYQDSMGAWHEGEQVERRVYCAPSMLGNLTMSQLRSSEVRITGTDGVPDSGMHLMHSLLIRAVDYNGETQVIYHGDEMQVIAATTEGENYRVIIHELLGNDKAT